MKLAIFDLDGVLVDTANNHFLAWQKLASKFNYLLTEQDNEKFKGVSRMACMDILCELSGKQLTPREKEEYATLKNQWYVESISDMSSDDLLDGAEELLQLLKSKGIKIALGSASKNAPVILDKTGIVLMFNSVIDGNSVSKAKPDPEVFLKAAQSLNIAAEDCVVFEDAYAGVEAAKKANMFAYGIGDEHALSNADQVVSSLNEIIAKIQ